jgi:hypothetical protein
MARRLRRLVLTAAVIGVIFLVRDRVIRRHEADLERSRR